MNSMRAHGLGRAASSQTTVHRFPVRVYYEDTDAAGIVYYANYLKFAERARSEWLREIGGDEAKAMKASGLLFVVRRCEIDYLQPARLDELLEVMTRVTACAGATLDLEQIVRRESNDLVVMKVTLACLNAAGRPARLPAALRTALATLLPAKEYAPAMATQLAQATDTQQAVPTTPVQVEPVQAVPAGPLDTTLLSETVQPDTNMTISGLFLNADIIVQCVVVLLVLASFWSWTIIFSKLTRLRRLRSRAKQFEESFWSGGSLEDLFDRIGDRPPDPMASVFVAAMREWRRSAAKGLLSSTEFKASLKERIERVMDITLGREMEQLERYMVYLASVGSSAPFVGLFGTVWGIMNSFAAIAASKNTSLAVVAPGIAEALFATALGLVAAIPAVLAYNKLSGDIGRYGYRLEAFAGEFNAILSRQLEERR